MGKRWRKLSCLGDGFEERLIEHVGVRSNKGWVAMLFKFGPNDAIATLGVVRKRSCNGPHAEMVMPVCSPG